MNIREKIQTLLKSTSSAEVKAICEKFLNTSDAEISDEKITETLFNELRSFAGKDVHVSKLFVEQTNIQKTVLGMQSEISKNAAQALMENWGTVGRDKKVSNVGNHRNNTLDKINEDERNTDKMLVEKLNVLAEHDPSAGEMVKGLKSTSYGVSESINTLKTAKVATHPQFGYILTRFENMISDSVSESKLVKDYLANIYPFKWDATVSESYESIKANLDSKAAEVEVQNAIIDIRNTDRKGFFTALTTKMNEWLSTDNRTIRSLFKEIKAFQFNPIVKSLTNKLMLMENSSGKLNVPVNNSNCTISKIYSPVILNNTGNIFKAGDNFYSSNAEGIEKLTEDQINALSKEYFELCEAFFNPAVSVVDDEVVVTIGKNTKVVMNTSSTRINEREVAPEDLGNKLMLHSQGSIFGSITAMVGVAIKIQENLKNICEIDYGKSIFSNLYEGTGVFLFKKGGKLFLNKINPAMSENIFMNVNGVQAVNLIKEFIGYNVSESIVDLLEGDEKKRSLMESNLNKVLVNIQLLENELDKVEAVIESDPEIGELPEITEAKDLLEKELSKLKSRWNEINIELKKFETATLEEAKKAEEKEEKEEETKEETKEEKAEEKPADDKKEVAPEEKAEEPKEEAKEEGKTEVVEEMPVEVQAVVPVATEVVNTGLVGAEGTQAQTTVIPGNDHMTANAEVTQMAGDVVNTGFNGAEGSQTQAQPILGGADVNTVQPTSNTAEITVPANIAVAATAQDTTQIQPEVAAGEPVAGAEAGSAVLPTEGTEEPKAEVVATVAVEPTAPKEDIVAAKDAVEPSAVEEPKEKEDIKESETANETLAVKDPVKLKGSDKMGVITGKGTAEHTFSVLWDGGETGEYKEDDLECAKPEADASAKNNVEAGTEETAEVMGEAKAEGSETEATAGEATAEIPEEFINAEVTIDFGPFKAGDKIEISASDYTSVGDDDAVKLKAPQGDIVSVPKKYVKISETKEEMVSKVEKTA